MKQKFDKDLEHMSKYLQGKRGLKVPVPEGVALTLPLFQAKSIFLARNIKPSSPGPRIFANFSRPTDGPSRHVYGLRSAPFVFL